MNDVTRYDRNLANNMLDFSCYESDSILIKNLVAFFSTDVNHGILDVDLFGKRILDPAVFAKQMGYKSYRSLLKKHPQPAQFKGKSAKTVLELKAEMKANGELSWETELCNSIYRMKYESLRFSKPGKTPDGLHTSELKELRFLKYAKKFFHPTTKKILYEIEYDETLVNNLARYFLRYSNDIYAQLRKASLQDLYIHLINLRESANKERQIEFSIDTLSFDFLCDKAGTHCIRARDNKQYLNNAFARINRLIDDEINIFGLTWERKGKHYYQPVITFRYSENELKNFTSESKRRFDVYFRRNILRAFGSKYTKESGTNELNALSTNHQTNLLRATQWLKDAEIDVAIKRTVYGDTHVQCFAKTIDMYAEKNNLAIHEIAKTIADQLLNDN